MTKSALQKYAAKRKFTSTPEPAPKPRSRRSGPLLFVIQKHAATRLHYDFRLELDGTLKSWAVPRGPSLDPADKRLAVQTEDHPIEYLDFEDIIPEGNYGAGPMIAWDIGRITYLETTAEQGLELGKLDFLLSGHKLR